MKECRCVGTYFFFLSFFKFYTENRGFKVLWSSIRVNENHLLGFEFIELYRNNENNYMDLNPQHFTYKISCCILIMPLPMENIHTNKINKIFRMICAILLLS